jgi:hypothetical protein
VLLKVVAFTADVRDDLKPVGETNFGDFTQRRVRLFGRRGVDASAYATLLRAILERGRFALYTHRGTWLANQLANGWHRLFNPTKIKKF